MTLINRMWAAPNIVCVCVDGMVDGVIEGRLYHRYMSDCLAFHGVAPILRCMDELFERINYPQSSVRERSFEEYIPGGRRVKAEPVLEGNALEDKNGGYMTFLINVRYRQKATWQGWLYCKEKDELIEFNSELELIKSLDTML